MRERYDIDEFIGRLPEKIRNVMTSTEGKLEVFNKEALFKFLDNISQINLDNIAEILIQDPDANLIEYYKKFLDSLYQEKGK